jgi:4,5:9,10-diseco-3-hydroxy-5,9,17-trioxoandrosta-1(10),2-diene-4-oate hydrolase
MLRDMPQDRYVEVNGLRARFWAAGAAGTAVVLLHGLGVSVETWKDNIDVLAQDHRVYAVDLPGFGRSDKPSSPYSLAGQAQFVRDFMGVEGIERASLIGNSLGGFVSLQFAIQFPEQLDKLVLVNSGGLGTEGSLALRLLTLPLVGEWLSRPSRKGVAQSWEDAFYDAALVTEEWVELYYQLDSLPGNQESMLATLRSLANLRGGRDEVLAPIRDNLGRIRSPTLVVWGQQDSVLPVEHARVAEAGIPGAQVHIFDHCGHMPQMEHPAEFNTLVREFLAE